MESCFYFLIKNRDWNGIVENQILDPKPPKQIFDLDTTD